MRPWNVLKTIGTQIPGVSAGVEIANQLSSFKMDLRVEALEKKAANNQFSGTFEHRDPVMPPQTPSWPAAVEEFLQKAVTIAVTYDGRIESQPKAGEQLDLPVAQACLIDSQTFLTCSEAVRLAEKVGRAKAGRVVMMIGMACHEITFSQPDPASGLVVGQLGSRNKLR